MGLMLILGYVYWLYHIEGEKLRIDDEPFANNEVYTLVGVGIVIIVIMFQYNIKVYNMLNWTIEGQKYYQQGNIEGTMSAYKKALSYNTILDRDSRTSLNRVIASNPDLLNGLAADKRQEILDYNIDLAEKNVAYNKGDSLNQMLLAQLLNVTASFNTSNPDKFNFYSDRALDAINKSIDASPGRIPVYFQKAQIYITRGQQDKAIETLTYAANLNLDYPDGPCYLTKTLLFYKKDKEAYPYMDKCIDAGGAGLMSPTGLVQSLINHYIGKKDTAKILKLYARLTELEPKNIQYLTGLAKLYADSGDKVNAKATAEKAIQADPSIKQYAEQFIKNLGL
jgi:tetratricopeptide (TPR) repeat protein